MYKFIENIEIVGQNNIGYIKNGFYFAERKKNDIIETFTMPKGFNSMIYEISSENEIDLILDCKDSYDNGADKSVAIVERKIIVSFLSQPSECKNKLMPFGQLH